MFKQQLFFASPVNFKPCDLFPFSSKRFDGSVKSIFGGLITFYKYNLLALDEDLLENKSHGF